MAAKLCLLLIFVVWSLSPASADVTQHRQLGFSKNGNIFVFEEFGVRDGTGNIFANIISVDLLDADSELNTMMSVEIEDDSTNSIGAALELVHAKIRPFFLEHNIIPVNPGRILASRATTQVGVNPYELAFSLYYIVGANNPDFAVNLQLQEADAGSNCARKQLYALTMTNLRNDAKTTVVPLETDTSHVKCPVDHHLSDVIIKDDQVGDEGSVLILVRSFDAKTPFAGATSYLTVLSIDLPR